MIPLAWIAGGVAIAFAAGLAGGYVKGHNDGHAALKADWDAQQLRQKDDYINRLRDTTEELELMRQREREKQDTYESNIRRVGSQRDAAIASLRNRAERAAMPASGAGAEACQGATGAQLSRPDAEFLAGFAARADELRAALARCQGGDIALEGTRMDH